MKKLLKIVLCIVVSCFFLTGCSLKNIVKGHIEKEFQEGSEKIKEQMEESNSSSDEEEIKLYSDNTKYVFEFGSVRYVFYYKGDKITGQETYIDYGSSEMAEMAEKLLKTEDLESVEKHYVKGKYLVLVYNKSAYENLTVSDIKDAYSYMSEVTKESNN